MNRCKTCKHWAPHLDGHLLHLGGRCNSDKLAEYDTEVTASDMLIYDYSEGGGFNTGPAFGCVHHVNAAAPATP